ncbi:MAG: creatininase family protein [Defluviitaleaceae bacterium]|nr:creatininase family protein [Defluviitaleaceae bacterium]
MKTNWMDMFPDEFFTARDNYPVCYMAYGLAEPHGTYTILGQDWLRTQLVLERTAAQFGGIVAPPFAWHVNEQQYYDWEMDCCGMGISLSSSIPEDLFLHNVLHHIRNMDGKGFRAGILLTGHCLHGLGADLRLLCEFYKMRTGSPMQFWAGQPWEMFDDAETKTGVLADDGDHAGVAECAELMALKADSVDMNRLNKINVPKQIAGGNQQYSHYCAPADFGKGPLPTIEMGQQIVAKRVNKLGQIAADLLKAYVPPTEYKIPSLLDTEEIWLRFTNLTRRYWGSVLTKSEAEAGYQPPPFPGWKELGE